MTPSHWTITILAWLVLGSQGHSQEAKPSAAPLPANVRDAFLAGIRVEMIPVFITGLGSRADGNRIEDYFAMTEVVPVATFDTSAWRAPGLRVWVMFPTAIDHWHHYTVAEIRGQAYLAGGFAAPELLLIDRALPSVAGRETGRAKLLAALADPNGATRLAITDTLRVPLKAGGSVVQLQTVSYQPHAYAPYRTTYRYTFLFSSQGKLQAWHRRRAGRERDE